MYSIFFLAILSIILLMLLFKIFRHRFNYFLSLLISFLILYIVLNPKTSINGVLDGANIFMKSIFPVMFPFMVCCNFLIYTDAINLYSKFLGIFVSKPLAISKVSSFPIFASYLSGYPMGAKYCALLFEDKKITHFEFERIINIASNAGPLFLIASVGTTMLDNTNLGYLLLIPSYLSSILIGFIFRKKSPENKTSFKKTKSYTLGEAIKKSIEDAMLTLIVLAGYIIFFCTLINIMKNSYIFIFFITSLSDIFKISTDVLSSLALGLIEITNGCNIIATTSISMTYKLCLISFLSSFGGFSILAQTYSFFSKHNVSSKKYISLKLLQGILSLTIMYVLCVLFKI